jgi:PAS domain S-box-containing protein
MDEKPGIITILLIEGNPDDADQLCHMLLQSDRLQVNLHRAESLASGLQRLSEGDIMLVMVALSLPDTHGLEGVVAIHDYAPHIPILTLASSENEHLALQSVHRGAEGYLVKHDMCPRELVRTIRCSLERHHVRVMLEQYTRELEISHQQFDAIVSQSADSLIIVDMHGKIRFVNPSAEILVDQILDDLPTMLAPMMGAPDIITEIDIMYRDGKPGVAEMRVQKIVWEGQPAHLVTLRDTTARKQTERALHESEQRYRSLLGSVTDYIYTVSIVDGVEHVTSHSPSCVTVTGYTAEEYDANPHLWYEMVYEKDRPLVIEQAANILTNHDARPLEHRIIHKDGSLRWVRNTPVPHYDNHGVLIAYDGLVSDITVQHLAQEEVRTLNEELEQRVVERTAQLETANAELKNEIRERKRVEEELRKFSRAIEQSPVSIVITDTQGNIEYVNPKFTEVTGYSFEEVRGNNPRILKSGQLPPELYTELWKTITGGREWRGEFHNKKKNGALFWEMASISPIVNSSGTITHFLGVKEDITHRKHAEAELQQARESAEAATRAKSEFLASMSHEIRTPLNAIIGMTTLLIHSGLAPEQHDYVETIRLGGETLLDIINDILDFSKIEAGKLELETHPFNICDCISESLNLVAPRALEKQLELAYIMSEDVPLTMLGDVTRLRQILVNLLSNAVKFTEQGEVVVSIDHWSTMEVSPATESENFPEYLMSYAPGTRPPHSYNIHISVRDTGIGIPRNRLDKLFRSFSQLDRSITRRYGGTGLGLAISKRLAEMMGGTMWVESEAGIGSTFHFIIVVGVAAEQPVKPFQHPHSSLAEKKVLIVDDNLTVCAILAQQVQRWKMRPQITTSAAESLAWLAAGESFDIVLIDMHLQEMNGMDLATTIRTYEGCQTLPMVMMSPLGLSRRAVNESKLNALSFLSKPVHPLRFYDTLIQACTANGKEIMAGGAALREEVSPLDDVVSLSADEAYNDTYLALEIGHRHPLRLLVAEDNTFNQKVILLLLERMGYRADIAMNGYEVLQALDRQSYDVILMDVQMPHMNGIEATRHIRATRPLDQQPWIIAMTAHALSGDREQCLHEGMDDYISKPIRWDELVSQLSRCQSKIATTPTVTAHIAEWSPSGEIENPALADSPGTSAQRIVAEPDMSPSAINQSATRSDIVDLTVLENFLDAIGEDSPAMKHEIMNLFVNNTPLLFGEMRQALKEHDSELLYRAAHTLKSNANQIGAYAMAEMCRELERFSQENLWEQSEIQVCALDAMFEQVRGRLEHILHDL